MSIASAVTAVHRDRLLLVSNAGWSEIQALVSRGQITSNDFQTGGRTDKYYAIPKLTAKRVLHQRCFIESSNSQTCLYSTGAGFSLKHVSIHLIPSPLPVFQ